MQKWEAVTHLLANTLRSKSVLATDPEVTEALRRYDELLSYSDELSQAQQSR